ncbi:hypothetical protein BDFB_012755, partial [Asbolus verrucosus]
MIGYQRPQLKIAAEPSVIGGFGMNMLMDQDIHCVILTSGTLAPLKPLISELELNVGVKIENPHIVQGDQICVKILTKGPDMGPLNCNYENRDNPKYLRSLGTVIMNLMRIIPFSRPIL